VIAEQGAAAPGKKKPKVMSEKHEERYEIEKRGEKEGAKESPAYLQSRRKKS